MYDPEETTISQKYLKKLIEECKDIAVMGGWATYFYVNKEYKKAFGRDYLKSRDIDIFVKKKDEECILKAINNMGFVKSAYPFRYELIYDRKNKKIIPKNKAKKVPIHNLFYIFLDIFSNKKLDDIGSWVIKDLNVKKNTIEDFPVVDINTLIEMKSISFFEREKSNKELKDACDLYTLINYSNEEIKKTKLLKKVVEKIKNRDDLCDFVAENVLNDPLKGSIVKQSLNNLNQKF